MKTTLNEIRNINKDSWEKLLTSLGKTKADDETFTMAYVLDTLGVADTLWVLCNSKGRKDIAVAFAADCAERVLHVFEEKYPDDKRPRLAIAAARDPNMSLEDKRNASHAAAAAATWAAAAAAYASHATAATTWAAAYAADAAWAAANAAADAVAAAAAERDWQVEHLKGLMV